MKRATRDQLCTSFSAAHAPVLQVQLGESFMMETNDRFATYEGPTSSPEAMEILKTMAGPVYIEGVKPGDTLKIEVLDVTLPLDYGWIGATPGRGPLGARIPAFRKARVQFTPAGVVFNERVTLPLRPMLGRIGVAPQAGSKPSNDRGAFGGSMGNTQITTGATVYLRVFHAGGLLTNWRLSRCHGRRGGDGLRGRMCRRRHLPRHHRRALHGLPPGCHDRNRGDDHRRRGDRGSCGACCSRRFDKLVDGTDENRSDRSSYACEYCRRCPYFLHRRDTVSGACGNGATDRWALS